MKSSPLRQSKGKKRIWLCFERFMAILALINYLLVVFDLSYIPLRDFWLQGKVQAYVKVGTFERTIPAQPLRILPFSITPFYDWVKGIEPYRTTELYLQQAQDLKQLLLNPDPTSTVKSPANIEREQQIDRLLAQLRQESADLVVENPFQVANKTGTLERIKNRMREYVFGKTEGSAIQAFATFWSREYFARKGTLPAITFFDRQIAPLMATNYFRPIGENGAPVDNFGLIDFPFFLIFLSDFLLRTWLISRRFSGISWFDAMLWRWYDVLLLIPVFRWLRIIPVTIRLNQAQLINLKAIQKQVSQGVVGAIAGDITEVVVLRVINQVQESIEEGAIRDGLKKSMDNSRVGLNNTNEVAEIIRLVGDIVANKVLPDINLDLEVFLSYSIQKAIAETPTYPAVKNLPGFSALELQLTQNLAHSLTLTLIESLQKMTVVDTQRDALIDKLAEHFQSSLTLELLEKNRMGRIEELINDLLEEVKMGYILRLSPEKIDDVLEQSRFFKLKKFLSPASASTIQRIP